MHHGEDVDVDSQSDRHECGSHMHSALDDKCVDDKVVAVFA